MDFNGWKEFFRLGTLPHVSNLWSPGSLFSAVLLAKSTIGIGSLLTNPMVNWFQRFSGGEITKPIKFQTLSRFGARQMFLKDFQVANIKVRKMDRIAGESIVVFIERKCPPTSLLTTVVLMMSAGLNLVLYTGCYFDVSDFNPLRPDVGLAL